jgi:SAM-dependent methyltransferase
MSSAPGTSQTHTLGRCPACEARSRKVWRGVSGGFLTLWRCGSCGVVYSDPQPRGEVLWKYLHEYDLADHFGAMAARKRVLFERRLDRLPRPPSRSAALCDVGCGDGLFLELAAARGWTGTGIDLNPPAVRRARRRGLEVIEGRVEETNALPEDHFDLVTAWDALEHTPEPRRFVERLAALTAPGGLVAISTLNRRSAVAWLFGSRWSMVVRDHFTIWDRDSLRRLMGSADLSVEAVHSYGVGRDFFQLLDRGRRARTAGLEADSQIDWATRPGVLVAESFVNRFLNIARAGVEIEMIARRRGGARWSENHRI